MTPALLMRQVEKSGGWIMGGITSYEYEMWIAEIEAEAREMYAADESEFLGRWAEWDSPKNVCKARYLERAEAVLEAARGVE